MFPLVGSSHLCDIRVHSGGIFNHFDSRKTSKAAFRLSWGSTSWVLVLSLHIQERVPAWFTVSTNGFKRNIWTWSSSKSLAWFLWWLQRNFLEIEHAISTLRFPSGHELLGISAAFHKFPNLISMLRQESSLWKKNTQIKVQTYLLQLILFYVCTHLTLNRYLWNGNCSRLNAKPPWQVERK